MTRPWIQNLFSDESGATAAEYAIVVVGVAMSVIVTVYVLGSSVVSFFDGFRGLLITR